MSETESSPTPFRPEIARRNVTIPTPLAPITPGDPSSSKTLTVGRDISLTGEIAMCDKLFVEGRVEADLSDASSIEIACGGMFKGTADVSEAHISGLFEGKLTARNRLIIHATGKVTGEVRYGELEIERGGELSGDVQRVFHSLASAPRPNRDLPRTAPGGGEGRSEDSS